MNLTNIFYCMFVLWALTVGAVFYCMFKILDEIDEVKKVIMFPERPTDTMPEDSAGSMTAIDAPTEDCWRKK